MRLWQFLSSNRHWDDFVKSKAAVTATGFRHLEEDTQKRRAKFVCAFLEYSLAIVFTDIALKQGKISTRVKENVKILNLRVTSGFRGLN